MAASADFKFTRGYEMDFETLSDYEMDFNVPLTLDNLIWNIDVIKEMGQSNGVPYLDQINYLRLNASGSEKIGIYAKEQVLIKLRQAA